MIGLNTAAVYVLQTLGSLYLLIVLLRFVLQLVRANFYNPLCQFIVKATQPLLKPIRRIIPSLFGLDMSSLLLSIVIQMIVMALTLQTALGAAHMAVASDVDAAELRRRVTSPAGTTEAAIKSFQSEGFETLVQNALNAAARRSAELAEQLGQ